jgi:hypothetical protein
MNETAEAKLQELRSKTNRQLASLISHKLDRGLAFARVLDGDEGRENWSSTEHFRVHAEQAYREASAWMPLLAAETQRERRRLEFKLAQLRGALDRVATLQSRAQAAC